MEEEEENLSTPINGSKDKEEDIHAVEFLIVLCYQPLICLFLVQ